MEEAKHEIKMLENSSSIMANLAKEAESREKEALTQLEAARAQLTEERATSETRLEEA